MREIKTSKWIVLAVVYLANITASFNQLKVGPVISLMMQQFQIDSVTAGFIISMPSIAGILLVFPSASILKKWGGKAVALSCLVMFFLGNLIGFLSGNLIVLMIGRFVEGFGLGMSGIASSTILNTHFTGKQGRAVMAGWSTWFSIGGALSVLLSSRIAYSGLSRRFWPDCPWKGVWAVQLIWILIVLLMFIFLVYEDEQAENYDRGKAGLELYRTGLANPKIWFTSAIVMLFIMVNLGFMSWSTEFYAKSLISEGIETAAAYSKAGSIGSLGYWFSAGGGLLAALVSSLFSRPDKIGYEKKRHVDFEHLLLIICSVIALAIWPFGYIYPSSLRIFHLIMLGTVYGFGTAVVVSVIPRDASGPRYIGVSFALMYFAQNLGGVIANPILGAVIKDASGNGAFNWAHGTVYMIILLILAVAVTIAAYFTKKNKVTY